MEQYKNDLNGLTELLTAGVSPLHTIRHSMNLLESRGFTELSLDKAWALEPGKGYFVNAFDTTLIGFTVGEDAAEHPSFRIASSHTDWPCLMVKPSPEISAEGYAKLNVAVYGGPILSTWLDRPLSLAGKVCTVSEEPFHPQVHLVDFKRPLLTVPNLAIHFNREVNNGVALNPQIDMQPILAMLDETLNKDSFFLDLVAEELHVNKEDILDYQFYIYNCDMPQTLGIHNEFLSAPRLDNLTSVHACLSGLMESSRKRGICVAALYDNEEIGSSTKQGAASPLTDRILEKIYLSLGYSRSDFLDALFGGFLLSLDVAHAYHPNKGEKYDPKDRVLLNDGVALKLAVNQAYATDASHVSVIEGICRAHEIPYKKFSNRSDVKGGSTLGSNSSCLLTMPAVDAGVALLAMHSSREMMGIKDQWALAELTRQFLA